MCLCIYMFPNLLPEQLFLPQSPEIPRHLLPTLNLSMKRTLLHKMMLFFPCSQTLEVLTSNGRWAVSLREQSMRKSSELQVRGGCQHLHPLARGRRTWEGGFWRTMGSPVRRMLALDQVREGGRGSGAGSRDRQMDIPSVISSWDCSPKGHMGSALHHCTFLITENQQEGEKQNLHSHPEIWNTDI